MADFSNTSFGSDRRPTAGQPVGLDQTQDAQAQGRLQPWMMPTGSYADTAQRWYTGANNEGMANGWDTEFYRKASEQRGYFLDKAAETQDGSWYLRWLDVDPSSPTYNRDATGVSLWNDPGAYGRGDGRGIRVGDVFENGKWVSNVYETYSDDRPTADLLLVDWVLEQDQKQRMFASDNRRELIADAMDAAFEENTRDIGAIRTQREFQEETQARQSDILGSARWQAGNVLAAGTAGAGLAAGAAAAPSLFGGPAAPVITGLAAVGGFAWGSLAAWWNRDQISELEARAMEITERSRQQYGDNWKSNLSTGMEQWSQVALTALNPLANTVQGINDDLYSDVGDGIEGFYEIDPTTGRRYAGKIAQGANFVALLGDSFLQFASPAGVIAYTGTMIGTTLGGTSELVMRGAGFDLRTGQFDEYEGAKETLAAIGNIGIDAVQVFSGLGLGALGRQARKGLGIDAANAGRDGKVVLGGMVYKVDELDAAIGARRMSIQMLAPSEAVQAVVIGQRARQLARRRGDVGNRALTADDYYRAAKEVQDASRVSTAFVTGVAEGAEEAVQAVLEPVSFSQDIDPREVGESAAMGFFSGAGMGLGATWTGFRQDVKDRRERRDSNMAHGLAEVAENRTISDEEWRARWKVMTPAEKRRAAILDQKVAARSNATVKQLDADMALEVGSTSIIGVLAHNEMSASRMDDALKDINPEAAGMYQLQARPSHRMTGVSGLQQQVFAENAALMSLFEVMSTIKNTRDLTLRDIQDVRRALAQHEKTVSETNAALVEVNERITNGERGLEDTRAELENALTHAKRLLAEANEREIDIQFDQEMATLVFDTLQAMANDYHAIDVNDIAGRMAHLDAINSTIVDMARNRWNPTNAPWSDEQFEAIRRAVEAIYIRDPRLGLSSYDLNIPQVSHELTFTASHRIIQTALQTFKPKNADTDGDTFATLRQVYIPPALRQQLRRGIQFFAAGSTHAETDDAGTAVPMTQVRESLADQPNLVFTEAANEKEIVELAAMALNDPDPQRQAAAEALLEDLRLELRNRYVTMNVTQNPPVSGLAFADAWKQFDKDLKAGVKGARENLMNALVRENPVGFLEMSDDTYVREPVHMMARVFDLYDALVTQNAAGNAADQKVVTPTGRTRKIPGRQGLIARSVQRAKNAGATLQAIGSSAAERRSQQQHYGIFRSTALVTAEAESGLIPDLNSSLIEDYNLLGGVTESEMDSIMNKYGLEDRVVNWLMQMLGVSRLDADNVNSMLMLAQAKVPNVGRDRDGQTVVLPGKTTVLQLLTKRSLEIERRKVEGKPQDDPVWYRLDRIERMTREQGEHSYTANSLVPVIFGAYPLHELAGEDAIYIGSQMTMDQMLKILMSQNLTNRRRTIERWKRMPGYVKEEKLGDPPYTEDVLAQGKINAFAIIVDSVAAQANVSEKERNREDDKGSRTFAEGFNSWKTAVETWHQQNQQRHVNEGLTTREQWVDDLLMHHPEWARPLLKMIPSQAHAATFIDVNGQVHAAKWFRKALAMERAEEAEVYSFVYSQFAVFNERQGTAGLDPDGKPRVGDGKLRYSDLDSQFLRMMFALMVDDPTRQELYSFVDVVTKASTIKELRDSINKHPNWLKNKAPWHPYTNDASAYETSTSEMFGGAKRDAARMEELSKFASGASATASASTEHGKHLAREAKLTARMLDSIANGSNSHDAKAHVRNLDKSIERAQTYPDAVGPAIMSEFFGMVMQRWARGHDKGKPAEQAANLGLPTAFITAFGLGTDIEQEQSALTANDMENLLSNPTRLTRSPVRLQNKDGSETIVDLTSAEKVLHALGNPVTRPLALAAIEPTIRDLNAQGGVTTYADRTQDGRPLEDILERTAKFTDVFDENLPKLQRALRGIGLIEAALREEALTLSLDHQDAMNFPITRMIADFLGAYMTSRTADKMSAEAMYEKAVIAVWESLILIAETPESLRTTVQAALEAAVLDQWGDPQATFDLYANDATKAFFDARWMNGVLDTYQERQDDLNAQLRQLATDYARIYALDPNDPQLDDLRAQQDALAEQSDRLTQSMDHLRSNHFQLPRRLFAGWEATLNQYQLTGDRDVDLKRKEIIAKWLLNGHQGNRFDGKKAQPLVDALVRGWGDAQQRMDVLTNSTKFDDSMWNELGAMAAALKIESEAGLPASWTSALPMTTDLSDPKSLNKYFDPTFVPLADPLFDPYILKAVERMLLQASRVNRQEIGKLTVVDQVRRKLFPPELVLGDWDNTVVKQALWVQQSLSGASTAITIPIGGAAADRLSDAVAASMATEGKPLPQHYTTADVTIQMTPGQSAAVDLMRELPILKLENHFMRSITLTPLSGNVDQQEVTRFNSDAGGRVLSASGVDVSGHRLYSTADIARRIDKLHSVYGMDQFQLTIEYVDVDKKPHSPEYVNSPLFDGMGRDGIVGGYASPLSAMFFGLGAIANVTQQKPLDALAKAGSAYRGYLTSKFDKVEQIESRGSVSEIIDSKTMALWQKKYGFGFLLYGDLPAVYKWVKSRHLVSGFNEDTQQQELWWAEKFITSERTGDPPPLKNPKLISLSEKTYKRLVGAVDGTSRNGESVRPAFQLQDVNVFPLLTRDRLVRLGLSDLGKMADLGQSDLRSQGLLPVLRHRKPRDAAFSTMDERNETWRRGRNETLLLRDGIGENWTSNRARDIESHNRPLLEGYVKSEYNASRIDMLMVPDTAMRQQSQLEAAVAYVDSLGVTASPNSITWHQMYGGNPDPLKGQFNSEDAASGFSVFGKRGPTFEDRVIFELQSYLMGADGDPDAALELFKRDAQAYSRRGVTIVLGSQTPMPEFRTMASHWLESGEIGYVPIAGTATVFGPRAEASEKTRMRETLDSTRIATRVFTRRGTTIRALHPMYGTRQGESTVVADPKYDPEYLAATAQVLPSSLVGANGNLNAFYAFNNPAGLHAPTSETAVLTKLRALLDDPVYYDFLLEQLGDDPAMPIFKRYEDGDFDPGILSKQEALARLKKQVDAGIMPGSIGSDMMTGSLKPVVTSTGTIMLVRLGFHPPKPHEIDAQLDAQPKNRNGAEPHNVVVSTNKFDDEWTISPPFTVTDTHTDIHGIRLFGDYDERFVSKWIDVLGAFKTARSPIPMTGQFPTEVPLGNQQAEDRPIRITEGGPPQEEVSKQAIREGLINNWRNAFALSGWDARPYLMRFLGYDPDTMSDEEFVEAWNSVADLLNMYAKTTNFSPDVIHEALSRGTIAATIQDTLNGIRDSFKPLNVKQFSFADRPEPENDPQDYIARRVLAVLGMEGVSLADVAYTQGLIDVVEDQEVTMLPDELTATFTSTKHPEVAEFLREEVNTRVWKPGVNGKPAYYLNGDWTWDVQYSDRLDNNDLLYKVQLQIVLPIPAKENAALLTQSVLNRGPRASSTPHTAVIDAAAAGGRLVSDRDLYRKMKREEGIVRFGTEDDETTFYEMLANVSKDDKNYVKQPKNLPIQQRFVDRATTKVAAYHHRIERDSSWTSALPEELTTKFLEVLNLDKIRDRREVDYLVRQFWGAPGPIQGQQDYREQITEELYIKALKFMLYNVQNRQMHPLHGGVVPFEHRAFWEKVFKAQHGAASPWAPVAEEGGKLKKKRSAETWEQWVASLIAQVKTSDTTFSGSFAIDIAGFWQSYQGSMSQYDITSLSPDMLTNLKLMDPDTNEYLLSLDPNVNALLSDPMLLDTVDKSLDALTGMQAEHTDIGTIAPDAMTLGDRVEHVSKWQRKQGLARKQKQQTFRSYMNEGLQYLESDRQLNIFASSLIHLQIINRLFLPALWVAAAIEVPIRAALEHTTDILTGNNSGAGGRLTSQLVSAAGYNPRLSVEDIDSIQSVGNALGASNELMAEIFREYTSRWNYQSYGSVANLLAKGAGKTALLFADPRRGMRNATIGRLYMDGVVQYLADTNSSVSVQQLVARLANDPMYLSKEARKGNPDVMNAHRAGMNRVAQTRGMRRTFTGKVLMAPVDTMLGSSSWVVQNIGAFLFIPFAFTTFTANVFIMLTGMQATDQMLARLFDQRENWLNRLVGFVQGSNYDPEKGQYFDNTDVLDGMNLSRSFIQSGISWTTLFTMGMLASSAGLGGEDEEERRRRRMAMLLNLPTYIDPVKADEGSGFGTGGAEHDFRQADMIYLDETPLKGWYQTDDGRSAVVPHWIVRQWTSPVMGMAKFFETGDMRELAYGFWDAASVIPYSALTLWRQANESFDIMSASIKEAEQIGTEDSEQRRRTLMVSTVGMLERALIDNQFVNSLWQAADEVDRAPWLIPATDEIGNILRQPGTGFPMAQEQALQDQVFIDPQTGEPTNVGATYMKRTQEQTAQYARAERSATYAVVRSLFDGQFNLSKSDYMRWNMVPRGREVPLPEQDESYVGATLYSAFMGEGGQPNLTEGEIVRILRGQAEDAGEEWDQDVLEAKAAEIFKTQTAPGALSVLDENGYEQVTQAGMDAILTGLQGGSLTLDHPALRGVWASPEMLRSIEADWQERVIEESLSWGMTKAEAGYRWRRFWWGDPEDPEAPGLKYLFDQIPTEPNAEYVQLNVTYTLGPDGRPWATPITKQSWLQALGLPVPHKKATLGEGLTMDARANVVDEVLGINTGLNALMKVPSLVPENEKDDRTKAGSSTPYTPFKFKKFPRRSGGGGGDFVPPFLRMNPLPESRVQPRPDDIPFINTSTPYVRRSNINQQRIYSERGRLKQWQ